jgi:hypothetical protein
MHVGHQASSFAIVRFFPPGEKFREALCPLSRIPFDPDKTAHVKPATETSLARKLALPIPSLRPRLDQPLADHPQFAFPNLCALDRGNQIGRLRRLLRDSCSVVGTSTTSRASRWLQSGNPNEGGSHGVFEAHIATAPTPPPIDRVAQTIHSNDFLTCVDYRPTNVYYILFWKANVLQPYGKANRPQASLLSSHLGFF